MDPEPDGAVLALPDTGGGFARRPVGEEVPRPEGPREDDRVGRSVEPGADLSFSFSFSLSISLSVLRVSASDDSSYDQ